MIVNPAGFLRRLLKNSNHEDFCDPCDLVHFVSYLLATGFAYVIPLSVSMADSTSVYYSGAHHWFGFQGHWRGVAFPVPSSGNQINSIEYYLTVL